MENEMHIRPMIDEDWPKVKAIYENGIATGMATFEKSAPFWESWDQAHLPFGRLVAVSNHHIAGWVALSPVSSRCVYGGVAEVSVYVHEDFRKKGIGKRLLVALIEASEQHNIWTLQAGIFSENQASINLHKKCGFRVIGYRERIGRLHGVWKDNTILERRSVLVGVD